MRVISNLFSNAIKFTKEGGISIKCDLTDQDADTKVFTFEVRDTGIGIPDKSIETIFQSFKQVNTSTSKQYGGSGLGLSIVLEYIMLMDGEITVDSKEGVGSKFVIKIPVGYRVFKSDAEHEQVADVIRINRSTVKGLSLLIIDDSDDYIEILKSYLSLEGNDIVSCTGGKEGFELYCKGEFDLVLLDCQMPIISGFKVSENIRYYEKSNDYHKYLL